MNATTLEPRAAGQAAQGNVPHYYWAPKYQIGDDVHWALCDTESDKEGKVSCAYMVLRANYQNGIDGKPVGKQDMLVRIAELLNEDERTRRQLREARVLIKQLEADRDREAAKVDRFERAVNAHAELVALLGEFAAEDSQCRPDWLKLKRKARAALAKAQGGAL